MVVDVLKAARALIASPSGWTQRTFARTNRGGPIDPCSVLAVCFCATGAVRRAAVDLLGTNADAERAEAKANDVLYRASKEIRNVGVIAFNDGMSHEAVLELFDKAIEAES